MEIMIIAALTIALMLTLRAVFMLQGQLREMKIYMRGVQDGIASSSGSRVYNTPHAGLND